MFYSGTLSLRYGTDLIVENAPATLHVQKGTFLVAGSWSVDAVGEPHSSQADPAMKAFYAGTALDVRFQRNDSREVYSGHAFIKSAGMSTSGLQLELLGSSPLGGFQFPDGQ